MADVTIALIPRDRFSPTEECLDRLFACTKAPFRLLIVDCDIPKRFRLQIERVVKGRPRVDFLELGRFAFPNECRNFAAQHTNSEFLCWLDNDTFVQDRWLDCLLEACERHSAGVALPVVLEGRDPQSPLHSATFFKSNLEMHRNAQGRLAFTRISRPEWTMPDHAFRFFGVVEEHCLFFRKAVLDAAGPFDEALNTRELWDLTCQLRALDVPVVLEPNARVNFVPPPPVRPEDRLFFEYRWDLRTAERSNRVVQERWDITNFDNSVPWIRRWRQRMHGPQNPSRIAADQATTR